MEVILLERVRNLGFMGDIVDVKCGYARNFLLPQDKALRVSEENKRYFETKKKELEARNLQRKSEAETISKTFNDRYVKIVKKAGDTGQLYGSVTKRDVMEALIETGLIVEATQVMLDRPFKILGIHEVKIELYPDVNCTVKLNVAISDDAAEHQEKTGKVYGLFIQEKKIVDKDDHDKGKKTVKTIKDEAKNIDNQDIDNQDIDTQDIDVHDGNTQKKT